MTSTKVEITKKAFEYLQAGGVWVFANEFKTPMKDLKKGEWVDFYFKNNFVGYGYVNPHSLIAGRICSYHQVLNRKDMFYELVQASLKRRQANTAPYQKPFGAFRGVYAESDWLPGLIIDIYDATVVAQSSTAGMDNALDDIIEVVDEILKPKEFVFKADGSIRHLEQIDNFIKIVRGDRDNLKNGKAIENELVVACDFIDGQKTGFFIDQRDNRRKIKEFCTGKSILDLCCYSGGWGLSAIHAGAKKVTFVDQSKEAIELVKRGVKLNNFDTNKVEYITSDVFDFLNNSKEKYDIIICDPPAFVKSKKNLTQAERAYLKLNEEAIKKLNSNGILATCSCSYHMSEENFTQIIRQAFSNNKMQAQVIFSGTQSLDHPWIINRPESHYLKCMFLKLV